MEPPQKSASALFQVYLRLRPAPVQQPLYPSLTTPDRFLTVEEPVSDDEDAAPTHITLNPPNDNRRRAVEKFAFTKVFEEEASQLDVFHGTGVIPLVEGVLGAQGNDGRDGLLATLGVTGSGKTHTILGSRNQRGLTQLSLDLLFRSLGPHLLDANTNSSLHTTVAAADASESQVLLAHSFLEAIYGDSGTSTASRANSRAATPMRVCNESSLYPSSVSLYPRLCATPGSPESIEPVSESNLRKSVFTTALRPIMPSFMVSTDSKDHKKNAKYPIKGESVPPPTPRRGYLQRTSVLPQLPDIGSIALPVDPNAEYAIVISMYEVYNDRIFDLLTPAVRGSNKDFRRRPLLFKPTEQSPDRKVVAGLRKIICGNVREALMVLEAGLHERRVAGTGSNSVSSRSHGFFCVEVKKRRRSRVATTWGGSTLTIVDLAGSERARDAKTQGATLAEAGKINESLMYLGQCLQMQSDIGTHSKPNLVPFRQCKLTELLFSNSFPSSSTSSTSTNHPHRNPQRATMIVTADPLGDFNATSQILRYSALAREVTVPRIPSVSSTILASSIPRSYFGLSHGTPSDTERETMEIAALEIARMSEEIDGLRAELRTQMTNRMELEAHLLTAEDKVAEIEAEVREECWGEMEGRMREEMGKWKASWEAEKERGTEHIDRKLEILMQGCDVNDNDGEDKENEKIESLEDENARLRRQVAQLQRQMASGSPTKQRVQRSALGEARGFELDSESRLGAVSDIGRQMMVPKMRDDSAGSMSSPGKKVRKLTARKWDLMADDDML